MPLSPQSRLNLHLDPYLNQGYQWCCDAKDLIRVFFPTSLVMNLHQGLDYPNHTVKYAKYSISYVICSKRLFENSVGVGYPYSYEALRPQTRDTHHPAREIHIRPHPPLLPTTPPTQTTHKTPQVPRTPPPHPAITRHTRTRFLPTPALCACPRTPARPPAACLRHPRLSFPSSGGRTPAPAGELACPAGHRRRASDPRNAVCLWGRHRGGVCGSVFRAALAGGSGASAAFPCEVRGVGVLARGAYADVGSRRRRARTPVGFVGGCAGVGVGDVCTVEHGGFGACAWGWF